MLDVVICGIAGKMGTLVRQNLSIHPEISCIGGVDVQPVPGAATLTVVTDLKEIVESGDVVVDFSTPESTIQCLGPCVEHKRALLIGTTGFSESQQESIETASETIPILQSSNYAIGVMLLKRFVTWASRVMGESYDAEIIEWHNRYKTDAPSGTALSLAECIATERGRMLSDVMRNGRTTDSPRQPGEITMHAIRAGNKISDHDVSFIGEHESISLVQHTFSRQVYMEGILMAIGFVADQSPGLYSLDDVLDQRYQLPPRA